MSTPLPKLSYVLLSHNREKYIRAAIESAFAQDYEGELEYIFSDDCSTDRTFEIIKECVAEYKGNRRVVVTQTPENLHLAGNTNHAVQFVESDWVIRADDDDISHTNRCSIIGKAIQDNPGCRYIFAQFRTFTDEEEESIIREKSKQISSIPDYIIYPSGEGVKDSVQAFAQKTCLHQAWHVDIYRCFGPLHPQGYYVDDVMSHYRAMMLGFGVYIPCTLAYIRTASNNMSRGGDMGDRGYAGIMKLEQFHDKYYNIVLTPLENTLKQLSEYSDVNHLESTFIAVSKHLGKFFEEHRLMSQFWRKGPFYRYQITKKLYKVSLFSVLRCLPMPAFAFILSIIRRIKNWIPESHE